jgi:ATP-dependent protease Clp ATPase subunit
MTDIMFKIPSDLSIEKVLITEAVVTKGEKPTIINALLRT